MPNELEVINQPMSELAMSRPPEAVLAEAQKAAAALKEVISKKSKPVIMNGEQYLEYEDWQTVGHFYGLKVRTGDAVPVEINGVHGAKAQAWVIDLHTGREIGGAEAYCLRDERNWETKPWFQLASMAQTRAGSKSLRNVLAWVVVLAGYKPTPAEEMAGVFPERKPVPQTRPRNDATMVQAATDVNPIAVKGTDKYTGEPIRQADNGQQAEADVPAPPVKPATLDTPAPLISHSPITAFCDEQASKAASDEHEAEGYIGTYQPRLAGKQSPPGRFVLETMHGEITMQFWEKPLGMGEPNHSYAKVTYRQSERAGKGGKLFTNNELLTLHWAAGPR